LLIFTGDIKEEERAREREKAGDDERMD